MKVKTERIERIIITVKLDDKDIDKGLRYCEEHGYEVIYRNPIKISPTKIGNNYRIVAEKELEQREGGGEG